jgi:hypothetical protein
LTGDSDFESFEGTYKFGARGSTRSRSTIIESYSNNKDIRRGTLITRALQYIETSDLSIRKPFDQFAGFTIATIPTQLSTRVLDMFYIDLASNEITSIELPRPVVTARCGIISKLKASSPIIYFLDDGDSTGTISSFKDLFKQDLNLSISLTQQIH